MLDNIKLIIALIVVVGALFGYYIYADYPQLYRVIALVVAGGVAIAIALNTERGRFVWAFVGEAQIEARKVVWPDRRETTQTTLLVVLMVLIVAVFLWLLDMMLGKIVEMFIG